MKMAESYGGNSGFGAEKRGRCYPAMPHPLAFPCHSAAGLRLQSGEFAIESERSTGVSEKSMEKFEKSTTDFQNSAEDFQNSAEVSEECAESPMESAVESARRKPLQGLFCALPQSILPEWETFFGQPRRILRQGWPVVAFFLYLCHALCRYWSSANERNLQEFSK